MCVVNISWLSTAVFVSGGSRLAILVQYDPALGEGFFSLQ